MRRFLAARVLQAVVVVVLVMTATFALVHLAPGEPFAYENPRITESVRAEWRHQFGYDRPLPEQFVRYLGSVAEGKMGWSHSLHRPASDAIAEALPRTLLLLLTSLAISFAGGIALGVAQARRIGSGFDRLASAGSLIVFSMPDFWLALIVLITFAIWIPLFPAGGIVDVVMHDYLGPFGRVLDYAKHLALPALTLGIAGAAAIARYQRAALADVLPGDFVRTARAKGVSESRVVWRHALRNALLPVITLAGLWLPAAIGGAVFVEKVFTWPGLGLMAVNAIASRDYDLVTSVVIVGAVLAVIGSLVADLLYAAADPRVREGMARGR